MPSPFIKTNGEGIRKLTIHMETSSKTDNIKFFRVIVPTKCNRSIFLRTLEKDTTKNYFDLKAFNLTII